MARIYKPEPKPKQPSFNAQRRHQLVYNDPRWRPIREAVLQRDNGLCQECAKQGRITPCNQVHHIISPFQVGISQAEFDYLAWDMANLEAICRDCHAAIHGTKGQTH